MSRYINKQKNIFCESVYDRKEYTFRLIPEETDYCYANCNRVGLERVFMSMIISGAEAKNGNVQQIFRFLRKESLNIPKI